MSLYQKNTKKQGDVGLGSAISYFTSKGLTVSIPLTDSQDYDLIVDMDGLKRVQIKTTRYRKPSGNFGVNLRVNGGNRSGIDKTKFFDKTKVELLYVLTEENDRYLIPTHIMTQRNSLSLNKKYDNFKV